jgi:hypothetical protein
VCEPALVFHGQQRGRLERATKVQLKDPKDAQPGVQSRDVRTVRTTGHSWIVATNKDYIETKKQANQYSSVKGGMESSVDVMLIL